MIVLYYSYGSRYSQLLKLYLEKNNIKHVVHNISAVGYQTSRPEVEYLLRKLYNRSQLVSTRTIAYKKNPLDLDELSHEMMVRYVLNHPNAMRTPILVSPKQVMFGFTVAKFDEFKRKEGWE